MTKREQILAAIKTQLTNVTGVVDANVFRSRVEPFTRGKVPAIVIEPVSDAPDSILIPKIDWSLSVRITVLVRGDVPDQIADPIIQSIHSKIMADQSIGGLAIDTLPGLVNYDLIEGDQPVGVVTMSYRVLYRTNAADMTQ